MRAAQHAASAQGRPSAQESPGALREDDYVSYTYRGHRQCLARGMDLEAAFAGA